MAEGEGTGEGTETGAGTGNEGLWRAQLPADLKDNEAFTPYKTLGDFGKAYLEAAGKAKELEGKTANAIFKPDDKATPEQREAYFRAIGKPEKPTEYEFPKGEGVEHDPKMVEWAQQTFHQANLNKEQAGVIAKAWDGFIGHMAQEQTAAAEKARTDADAALKAELGDGYAEAAELATRFLTKHASAEDVKFFDETKIGNHPGMIRLIVKLAKLTGEDVSLQGGKNKGDLPSVGMNYTSMNEFK